MSDKFKQFKNELIDLCEKYGYGLWIDSYYEIHDVIGVCSVDLKRRIDKYTPKEDI